MERKIVISLMGILGIFVLSCNHAIMDINPENLAGGDSSTRSSLVIPEFSWYEYTVTPMDQKIMGPCHLIASVGVIESAVRIFYNQKNLNINMAERYVASNCNPGSDPMNAATAQCTMAFAQNNGLVDESVFKRYDVSTHTFYGSVSNADVSVLKSLVTVTIPEYRQVFFTNQDDIKRAILQFGPLVASLLTPDFYNSTGHGVQIIGWKTLADGTTNWEILDSWPGSDSQFSARHYWKNLDFLQIKNTGYISLWQVVPVANDKTVFYKGSTVQFFDNDNDGYYSWGTGPKPVGCPGAAEPDGDDNNPLKGPRDANGYCIVLVEKINFTLNSQGYEVSLHRKFATTQILKYSCVFYDIPVTGYYMSITGDGKTLAYSDKVKKERSGSILVLANVDYTFTLKGGYILQNGIVVMTFFGSLTITQ